MDTFKNMIQAIYRNPQLFLVMVPFVFLLSTILVLIALLIPLGLLEAPVLHLLVDVFGWNWTVNDYRWVMTAGLAFWLGFFWCATMAKPSYWRDLWKHLANKD